MELKSGLRLDKQLRRLVAKQIGKAADALQAGLDDNAAAEAGVFVARKRVKRARAVLLLLRPHLDRKAFKRRRAHLRSIGRLLSGTRDAHVTVAIISQVRQRCRDDLDARSLRELEKLSASRRTQAQTAIDAGLLSEAVSELRAFESDWSLNAGRSRNADIIFSEIARLYSSTRRRFRKACRSGDAEAFHDWRKDMQRHRRHMQLVAATWPGFFAVRAVDAARIAALLGADHDLGLLAQCINSPANDADKPPRSRSRKQAEALAGLNALEMVIERQRQELRAELMPLAKRLLSLKPRDLERIIKQSWQSAQALEALAGRPSGEADKAEPATADQARRGSADENKNDNVTDFAARSARTGDAQSRAAVRSVAEKRAEIIPALRPRAEGVSQITARPRRDEQGERPRQAIADSLASSAGRRPARLARSNSSEPKAPALPANSDAAGATKQAAAKLATTKPSASKPAGANRKSRGRSTGKTEGPVKASPGKPSPQ